VNYSKGITWFDDCRIPFVDEGDIPNDMDKTHLEGRNFYTQIYNGFMYKQNTNGRFPANLLCSDDVLNDGIIYKSGDGKSGMKLINHNKNNFAVGEEMTFTKKGKTIHYGDKGTNSRYYDIDKWFEKMINELF